MGVFPVDLNCVHELSRVCRPPGEKAAPFGLRSWKVVLVTRPLVQSFCAFALAPAGRAPASNGAARCGGHVSLPVLFVGLSSGFAPKSVDRSRRTSYSSNLTDKEPFDDVQHTSSSNRAPSNAVLRCVSFVLLLLALAGYCGLPSNPPAGLFEVKWLEMVNGESGADRRLVAPTQVKEHRAREGLTELDHADSGKEKAAAAVRPEKPFAPDTGDAAATIFPTIDTAALARGQRQRAPPFGLPV